MNFTAEQLMQNWASHLDLVHKHITGDRQTRVLHMLMNFQENAVLAPASSKKQFHNSFPGGYIDHVNRMVNVSIELAKVWKKFGASLDFTAEELVFSALFCCLGKLGDIDENENNIPYFVPQTNAWRKDNLGEYYVQNPKLDYMLTQDRSLYILQKFNISMSVNEYLAIRLYDGGYNDANKSYYNSYNEGEVVKSNLVHIINLASDMTSKIEVDFKKIK